MGYIACEICDECLSFDIEESAKHVCNPGVIKARIRRLEEAENKSRLEIGRIQNAVEMIVSQLPSIQPEGNVVSEKWIRELWAAARCRFFTHDTADSFLSMWLTTHRILCEAFPLFSSGGSYRDRKTIAEKLEALRDACVTASKANGYDKDGERLNLSVRDVLKQAASTIQ